MEDHHKHQSLEVRSSLISGAGQGLFASSVGEGSDPVFRAGDRLPCTYTGTVLRFMQLVKMPEEDRDYVMGLHFNVHVDAKDHPEVLARYINDRLEGRCPEGEDRHNVRFLKLPRNEPPLAAVVALRDIYGGEELYADYGSGYWKKHRR